jgi:hypothetical protein
MKLFIKFFILLSFTTLYSQEEPNFAATDSLYREDQFYFGITYNFLNKKPIGVSQNSFSTGLNLGFLRDFPINKSRTIAIAAGLGFSYNNYKENLIVDQTNGVINYSTITPGAIYNKNKLALYFVDLPIELRWRTSTYDSHVFWRIYAGFKFSYLLLSQSRYIDENKSLRVNNNPLLNKFQYGAYMAAGHNSWNLYVYYGLQDIFKDSYLNDQPIKINTFNIGLIFYIL